VLVAGGGRNPPALDYLSAQVYSPPYLFRGPRPTIASAPGWSGYGSTMTVQTPDAADIASVALVGLGVVSHTNNMDQRFVDLAFDRSSNQLYVQTPADGNVAPPGPGRRGPARPVGRRLGLAALGRGRRPAHARGPGLLRGRPLAARRLRRRRLHQPLGDPEHRGGRRDRLRPHLRRRQRAVDAR